MEIMLHELYVMMKGKQIADSPLSIENFNNKFKSTNFTTFAGYSGTSHSTTFGEWVIDSGATSHMCSTINLFTPFNKGHSAHQVILPDGSYQAVTHMSIVPLSTRLHLKNVLYVPLFKFNLLSVGQLLEEEKISVIFKANCWT